ncbi:MAG TPA: alpha-1,2-fucosyltransferase [Candidatus Paceibacterota bacterium]|nr:alpha-1,2-fucosyltransferase [Candidatus Paceibacterota bacterium]
MITTKLQGGLGNQLFQYAAGRALSERHNTDLVLDIEFYGRQELRAYTLGKFSISARIASHKEPARADRLVEKGFSFDSRVPEAGPDTYLEGYWQSERYFKDIESVIRREFALKDPGNGAFKEALAELGHGNSAVSLHVRRTDYLAPKHQGIYAQLTPAYYLNALQIIAEKNKDLRVIIFSDDVAWVKENLTLPFPTLYMSGRGFVDYEELVLMSACAHHITANSSFSWWGAWLNPRREKIVVTPEHWFVDGRDESDLIPPSWIRL